MVKVAFAWIALAGCGRAADTGDVDAAAPPALDGGPPPGKVAMFVAQGQVGRTVVSCDDGNTWIGNHSWDRDADPLMCEMPQQAICGQVTCSYEVAGACAQIQCCDDTPDIAEGVAFGPDAIAGAWGHGKPGAVRSTRDGVTWTTQEISYAYSLAYGGGVFVAAGNPQTSYSSDGLTWQRGGDARFATMGSPVRAIGYGDGRFVAVSSGGGLRDILISSDGGQTWWRPSSIPATCALGVGAAGGGILGANGILVIVDSNGTSCVSVDGGDHWTVHATGVTQIASQGVWTGSEFVFWSQNMMLHSSDGASWQATPQVTPTAIGPVARSDQGTFVAIRYLYDGYDRQHFLRSTDGTTWTELPDSSIVQSHPIFHMASGYADRSDVCP